jgi:hypothetical protein
MGLVTAKPDLLKLSKSRIGEWLVDHIEKQLLSFEADLDTVN